MKNKRKNICLILATAIFTINLTGCENYASGGNESVESENLLDIMITNGEDETTPRKVLEASEESIKYASFVEASGEYKYEDKRYTSFLDVSTNVEGPISYKRTRDEDNNVSSELTVGMDYHYSYYSTWVQQANNKDWKSSQYSYYKQNINGEEKQLLIYYGSYDICSEMDLEMLLIPEISELTVTYAGYIEDIIVIETTADSFTNSRDKNNILGKNLFEKIRYEFNAKDNVLQKVKISGLDYKSDNDPSTGNYSLDYDSKSASIELNVKEISYAKTDMIEIPQAISQNGYINDVVMGEQVFKGDISFWKIFYTKNEWYEKAEAIVGALDIKDYKFCTIDEMSTQIENAALENGFDKVEREYALVGSDPDEVGVDKAVYIRYSFYCQDELKGYIVVPIGLSQDTYDDAGVLVASQAIALDAAEYSRFAQDGRVQFVHEYSPTVSEYDVYKLDEWGIELQYSQWKETKLSNLSSEEELGYFDKDDREVLSRMASELDIASVSGITEYDFFKVYDADEKKVKSGYERCYVLDIDLSDSAVEEISEKYGISVVSKSAMESKLSKLNYSGEEKSVKWVQILDE